AQTISPSSTPFEAAFAPGQRDDSGRFIGGTEMRVLARHGGKLYAGNGYWEDRPGPEGSQGAQILVLDRAGGRWQGDQGFDARMAPGHPRVIAVSALHEVNFATDWRGERLPAPAAILLASVWDLTGATRVFARDDQTGQWSAYALARDPPSPRFLPQIRSFAGHRDRVTGIDLAFAGQDPRGIFSGGGLAAAPPPLPWLTAPQPPP